MADTNNQKKISIPDIVYSNIMGFLKFKAIDLEVDWGKIFGPIYLHKGRIYYLDEKHTKIVRITNKYFFGLIRRKVELSDKVEQETIDEIEWLIKHPATLKYLNYN